MRRMEFYLGKASDYFGIKEIIRINRIEDLERIYNDYGKHKLIIDFGSKNIIIYDDHVE